MTISCCGSNIILSDIPCLNIPLSLDCGQAFRWRGADGVFTGVAGGRRLTVSDNRGTVTLHNTSEEDFNGFWRSYFDLDTDYAEILSSFSSDETLNTACHSYYGIRILRQEPWEALCSFIISANNNIPRIKGIIDRLCALYGKPLGDDLFTFPDANTLAALSPEDLAPIRSGFRAKYIIDAARCVASGEIDLDKIREMPLENASAELKKVKGVGDKVAACSLLYGFHRLDAFPIDVWVRRVLSELYPNGLPKCVNGYEGVAQQYLFHYIRNR